jgi:predicted Mrr-cat superfamily restriction endonuclease
MNVWKIYSREAASTKTHQEFARECYQAGVIAVGWNQIGDLNAIGTRDKLHALLTEKCGHWADYNASAISQWTGSLWSFRTEVKPGDYVVCPDGESDQYYVGRIQSARVYRDKRPLGGTCPFANRRKVKWLRILNRAQIERIWPSGQFGGRQTVSTIREGVERLLKLLSKRQRSFAGRAHLPIRPDMEWGKEAEARAMAWLRKQGRKPLNESDLNKGWDIACGDDKFEVKGRKSKRTAIRLSQNEWAAAKRLKKRYTVLVFTAATKEKLHQAMPKQIADPPSNPESWQPRPVYEYILVE